MNKRLVAVVITTAVISLILGFFLAFKVKAPELAKPGSEVQEYIKQAEKNLQDGNLLKAKEIYSKIIEEHPDSEFIEAVQDKLEGLNMRLLFSPAKTKNSLIHTVKEGDTLRKIAKKYGTTVELLMKSNKLESDLIHPGKWLKVTTAKFSIIVDKSQNVLIFKADDEVLKVYTVSTGIANTTPTGEFKIVNKLIEPTWYKAGAIVSSGSPENILGSRWMGLSLSGYGIHGTTQPQTVGKHITAGCIRMHNRDVEELYSIIPVGTGVVIVD